MTPEIGSVTYHASTAVGQKREHNEDNHGEFTFPDGALLLVVADGMGGHEGGEIASQIAVEAIGHIVRHSPATDPRERLHNGFLVAHQRVVTQAEKVGKKGMGTTAVAVHVKGDEAYVAHVGDSRCYLVRKGGVVWVTTDHTRVQKMVSMGILSAAEAKHHPDANIVTRAIGHGASPDGDGPALVPEIQKEPLILQSGDVLVLCSDGLYDDVTDAEIAAMATGEDLKQAAEDLIDLANQRGGHDNITVSIMRYGHAGPDGPEKETAHHTSEKREVARPTLSEGSSNLAAGRTWGMWFVGIAVLLFGMGVLGYVATRKPPRTVPTDASTDRRDARPLSVPDFSVSDLARSSLGAQTTPAVPRTLPTSVPAKPAQSASHKEAK